MAYPCLGLIAVDIFLIQLVPPIRRIFDLVKVRIPVWGKLARETAIYLFSNAMELLLHIPDIPIVQKWSAASRFAQNLYLTDRLNQGIGVLEGGGLIADAMAQTGLFQSEDIDRIAEAENLGRSDEAFSSMAARQEKRLEQRMERISKFTHGAIVLPVSFILGSLAVVAYFRSADIPDEVLEYQLSGSEIVAAQAVYVVPTLAVVLIFLAILTRPRAVNDRLLGGPSPLREILSGSSGIAR